MAGLHPDAAVVTHWRAAALIKHCNLKMPFHEIEENGWELDIGGRHLEFIFTPYLHFPGAFCTFDALSGIMFSGDIFGGMTRDWSLVADGEPYFEDIRPFHEHYMPAREILLHGLMKIEERPIRLIAPQHGSLIHGGLIGFVIERLKQLDCGLFALAADSTDIRRLSFINKTLKDMTNAVIMYRDFRDVANALAEILRRTLPVSSIEFYADVSGRPLHIAPETRFRGAEEEPPEELRGIRGAGRSEWYDRRKESYSALLLPAKPERLRGNVRERCLAIPLFSPGTGRADAVAVIRLVHEARITKDMNRVLERMGETFGIAVEREIFYQMLDAERARFYEQSIRDPLTGLYSRFYMEEALRRLASAHDRDARNRITAAMFDLDRFKEINDACGHIAGDEAIKRTASVIRTSRASDIAVRYGGEEFAVFLTGNTAGGTMAMAEKIRRAVAAIRFEGGLSAVRLTLSAGVAGRRQGEGLASFLNRADRAMYQAKASGRDRVVYLEED